ncbi:hypothetical protein AVEN_269314-1 [Araneus ventricosus]|uniref:Mutator-like transposase domain-containing protein n=1 Tax=Araneus ventricosus TaxID=182803 RepID=A0A4Y2I383_ARAVE|nr:hypothetical protein AVEN_269314-1 [Araneus ventricosus]
MGRSLTLPLCLLVLAGNNGVAFTPWVALPGEITPDVYHPLLPGTPLATRRPLTGRKGYNGGRKLFCLLDLPFLSKNTFRRQEMKLKQSDTEAATESMETSANGIMLLKGTQKDTISCGVSMDGKWQKRGYSSLNDCVSCILVDTGKVLDIEIMSNFCKMCNNMPSSKYCSKYVCRNHKGSSSSMEKVGAYRIFQCSEVTRNLQYTQYYGGGDSEAYNAVKGIDG